MLAFHQRLPHVWDIPCGHAKISQRSIGSGQEGDAAPCAHIMRMHSEIVYLTGGQCRSGKLQIVMVSIRDIQQTSRQILVMQWRHESISKKTHVCKSLHLLLGLAAVQLHLDHLCVAQLLIQRILRPRVIADLPLRPCMYRASGSDTATLPCLLKVAGQPLEGYPDHIFWHCAGKPCVCSLLLQVKVLQ